MEFRSTRLPNGLEIVAELSPHMHSAAVGFYVRTGSRDETPEVAGVSHFLEHMVFKGTARHSGDDVNRLFDEIGAKYNAYTTEEQTTFYAAVLPEYLPQTVDLLADILRPALRQDDFDMEKKVILEEIGMYEDRPTHVLYEATMQQYFRGHPLGHSVLGSQESVSAIRSDQMRSYHAGRYAAGNIVLAAAGKLDWQELLDLAERHCSSWPSGDPARSIPSVEPTRQFQVVPRKTSVQELVMSLAPAPLSDDRLRFAADLLTVVVGDDTGSRLYWELVDPGHVEAADLGYHEFDGAGAYMSYLAGRPEETLANLQKMEQIFADVNERGVTETELTQAKNKILSRTVLRSERPMSRLGAIGNNWQYRKEYRSVQDDLNDYRNVSLSDIRDLLDRYPLRLLSTVAVGPLEELAWEGH